jgi:hypothetical protein
MDGLLGSLKQQWQRGEPYRVAAGGLLSGDVKPAMGLLNAKSKVKPMTVDDAMQIAMDWGPMGIVGHTVYHGSPHKFNKFDMSKIGTGEGAQAYGHGLYFADSPEVGQQYARMNLTGPANVAHVAGRDGGDAMAALKRVYPGNPKSWYESAILNSKDPGNLYKVDIPDEAIPKMLDWDKPLSQQSPEVKQAYKQFVDSPDGDALARQYHSYKDGLKLSDLPEFKDPYGETLYKNVFGWGKANNLLQGQGIPGIRYLDGSSRGTGHGTNNYVVFDDNLPKILEVNGKPLK